jgi:hypothetical protein
VFQTIRILLLHSYGKEIIYDLKHFHELIHLCSDFVTFYQENDSSVLPSSSSLKDNKKGHVTVATAAVIVKTKTSQEHTLVNYQGFLNCLVLLRLMVYYHFMAKKTVGNTQLDGNNQQLCRKLGQLTLTVISFISDHTIVSVCDEIIQVSSTFLFSFFFLTVVAFFVSFSSNPLDLYDGHIIIHCFSVDC